MTRLEVERLGGIAGFGLPGSRLRSRGQVEIGDLAPADRQAIEALFDHPPGGPHLPDAFRYRLTLQTPGGRQVVEVPEQHVPPAVRSVVQDEIA